MEGNNETPTIKFSHIYPKIPIDEVTGDPITEARLLQVLLVKKSDLTKEFLEYDTKYYDEEFGNDDGYGFYKVPDGELLMLFFHPEDAGYMLFTTLRGRKRVDKSGKILDKLPYYQGLVGKVFKVIIANSKEM